jgi:hypothetical protein
MLDSRPTLDDPTKAFGGLLILIALCWFVVNYRVGMRTFGLHIDAGLSSRLTEAGADGARRTFRNCARLAFAPPPKNSCGALKERRAADAASSAITGPPMTFSLPAPSISMHF